MQELIGHGSLVKRKPLRNRVDAEAYECVHLYRDAGILWDLAAFEELRHRFELARGFYILQRRS